MRFNKSSHRVNSFYMARRGLCFEECRYPTQLLIMQQGCGAFLFVCGTYRFLFSANIPMLCICSNLRKSGISCEPSVPPSALKVDQFAGVLFLRVFILDNGVIFIYLFYFTADTFKYCCFVFPIQPLTV